MRCERCGCENTELKVGDSYMSSKYLLLCKSCAILQLLKIYNVKNFEGSTHVCEGVKNFKNCEMASQVHVS